MIERARAAAAFSGIVGLSIVSYPNADAGLVVPVLDRRLRDDLAIVNPDDPGQCILNSPDQLGEVGYRHRERGGRRTDSPLGSEVPPRSSTLDVNDQVQRT